MGTKAGNGNHHIYKIPVKVGNDTKRLTARKHYLGIDAVSWFINREGGWFSNRMASGTLSITLSGGLERYQAALGTFELKDGSKIAPVFENPVLPDRNYRGGPVTITASLTAIRKDNGLGSMLKGAAKASLGIVAGMVDTATVAGPARLLASAGDELIGGVQKVLSETGEKREALFDFAGLQFSISPDDIKGPHTFILLHRGAELDQGKLAMKKHGQTFRPLYEGKVLEDGAWLLLRIRRSDQYKNVRPWDEAARILRKSFKTLVEEVEDGVITAKEALKRLKPSLSGDGTIYDDYSKLRTIINQDGVLTEREAGLRAAALRTHLVLAKGAIESKDFGRYHKGIISTSISLKEGKPIKGEIASVFLSEVNALTRSRVIHLAENESSRNVARMDDKDIFSSMQYLPGVISRVV